MAHLVDWKKAFQAGRVKVDEFTVWTKKPHSRDLSSYHLVRRGEEIYFKYPGWSSSPRGIWRLKLPSGLLERVDSIPPVHEDLTEINKEIYQDLIRGGWSEMSISVTSVPSFLCSSGPYYSVNINRNRFLWGLSTKSKIFLDDWPRYVLKDEVVTGICPVPNPVLELGNCVFFVSNEGKVSIKDCETSRIFYPGFPRDPRTQVVLRHGVPYVVSNQGVCTPSKFDLN